MRIGLGGESNWTAHTESGAHRKNEASKKSTSAKLTSFFKKKLPGSSPKSSATAPSLLRNPTHSFSLRDSTHSSFLHDPTRSFSSSSQAGLSSAPHIVNSPNNDPIVIELDGSPSPPPMIAPSSSTTSLLSELERVSVSLPLSTPEGTEMDILARFSVDPVLELEAGDDAWEMADRALNGVIGYGKTVEEIATIIRRGPLGMDGLCRWLKILVSELQVDEVLLEGKIKRLIDAMVLL